MRPPSSRIPLCLYSLVTHWRRPRIWGGQCPQTSVDTKYLLSGAVGHRALTHVQCLLHDSSSNRHKVVPNCTWTCNKGM